MIYIPEHSMSYCGSRNEFQSAPDLAWYQMKDGSCICHDMAIDGSHAKRSIVEIRAAHSWTYCKEQMNLFMRPFLASLQVGVSVQRSVHSMDILNAVFESFLSHFIRL